MVIESYIKTLYQNQKTLVLYHHLIQHKTHSVTSQNMMSHMIFGELPSSAYGSITQHFVVQHIQFSVLYDAHSSVHCTTQTFEHTVRRTEFSTQYDAHSSVHCTTHTVEHTVRRTDFSTQYDAHSSVHYTTHTVQYTVQRTQFRTLYDAHSSVHCTTHTVQYTVRRTQFSTLYDAHSSYTLNLFSVFSLADSVPKVHIQG